MQRPAVARSRVLFVAPVSPPGLGTGPRGGRVTTPAVGIPRVVVSDP